jgi:hypothetical protein
VGQHAIGIVAVDGQRGPAAAEQDQIHPGNHHRTTGEHDAAAAEATFFLKYWRRGNDL